MSRPSKRMLPRARGREPEDRAQRRRLAGAVRAEQRDDLARRARRATRRTAPASRRRTCRCRRPRASRGSAEAGAPHPRILAQLGRRALRRSPGPSGSPRSGRRGRTGSCMSCSMTTIVSVLLQLGDEVREARRPVAAEAGGRLVEEEQARLGGERDARSRARAARRTTGSSPASARCRRGRRARARPPPGRCAAVSRARSRQPSKPRRADLGQRDQARCRAPSSR